MNTADGILLGTIEESSRACACPPSWFLDVKDHTGEVQYVARTYAGGSCLCLPNACCRSYTLEILTPELEETGAVIRNCFPGCNGRGCCNALRQADNMQVTFPEGSDMAMRAVLLGAGVLAQYTFFSSRVRARGWRALPCLCAPSAFAPTARTRPRCCARGAEEGSARPGCVRMRAADSRGRARFPPAPSAVPRPAPVPGDAGPEPRGVGAAPVGAGVGVVAQLRQARGEAAVKGVRRCRRGV